MKKLIFSSFYICEVKKTSEKLKKSRRFHFFCMLFFPHILIVGFLFSLRSARPPHDLLLHSFLLSPSFMHACMWWFDMEMWWWYDVYDDDDGVMMWWWCDYVMNDDMMMWWWGSMMRLYMGLGMDLLASTFERLQILALQFIKNLCPWPTKKIVKLESKSAEWKYQNRFSSIWMS